MLYRIGGSSGISGLYSPEKADSTERNIDTRTDGLFRLA